MVVTNVGVAHLEIFGSWERDRGGLGRAGRRARAPTASRCSTPTTRWWPGSRNGPRAGSSPSASTPSAEVRAEDVVARPRRPRVVHARPRRRTGCRCRSRSPVSTWCRTRSPPPAVGLQLGVSLARTPRSRWPTPACRTGAWRRSPPPTGIRVVNDAYNANPESVAAALKTARWMAGDGPPDRGARHHGRTRPDLRLRSTSASASSRPGSASTGLITVGRGRVAIATAGDARRAWSPTTSAAYDDPDEALADVRALARARRRRAVQGLPRRRAREAGGGAAVNSILVAAAVGLAVTLLGTPIAIRAFRVWGWGQRIREDGPHTHFEKMGTPTMGGIVMLIAPGRQLRRHPVHVGRHHRARARAGARRRRVRAVGFVDDFTEGAPPPLAGAVTKSQKFLGTAVVSVLFARRRGALLRFARGTLHEPVVRPRHRGQARGLLPALVLPGAHGVLERREPHRRSRRLGGGLVDPGALGLRLHRLLAVPPPVRRHRGDPTRAAATT